MPQQVTFQLLYLHSLFHFIFFLSDLLFESSIQNLLFVEDFGTKMTRQLFLDDGSVSTV